MNNSYTWKVQAVVFTHMVLLSEKEIPITKYSICTRTSEECFISPKVNMILLSLANSNSYSTVISGKVRDGSNDFDPRNFNPLFNELIRGRHTPLLQCLKYDIFELLFRIYFSQSCVLLINIYRACESIFTYFSTCCDPSCSFSIDSVVQHSF